MNPAIDNLDDISPKAPFSRLRRLLSLALLFQVALAGVGLVSARSGNSDSLEFVKPDVLGLTATPIDVEGGFPIAVAYALQWSDDSRLIAVTMRLDWGDSDSTLDPSQLPGRGWVIYVFEHDGQTLSVYLDRGTGILIGQNVSPFGGDTWPTLDLTTYPRSSSIAAITANITVGSAYREACEENRNVAVVTARSICGTDPESRIGTPVWAVTFGDQRFPGTFDSLVRMDANSGEVVTSEVRERACDG